MISSIELLSLLSRLSFRVGQPLADIKSEILSLVYNLCVQRKAFLFISLSCLLLMSAEGFQISEAYSRVRRQMILNAVRFVFDDAAFRHRISV